MLFHKHGNMALRTVDGTAAMRGYGGTGYGYTVIICVIVNNVARMETRNGCVVLCEWRQKLPV
jgi:hypothetical protein